MGKEEDIVTSKDFHVAETIVSSMVKKSGKNANTYPLNNVELNNAFQ